ncbi:MAG: hypothetical protein M3O50_15140 [Myxococcota bacterium]|nr:hypothetical protein [Myxococcota bacterium]
MLRRVLRTVLFAGVALALWSMARPAAAMPAPLCDDRGASAIAPPPTLQAPADAIRRTLVALPCAQGGRPLVAAVTPTHPRPAASAPDGDKALPIATLLYGASPAELLPGLMRQVRACHGVRSRVDRPPRR